MIKRQRGLIAKIIEKIEMVKQVISIHNVLAEEPAPPTDPQEPNKVVTPPQPQLNFEDLIAKAREDEKKKLYPKITALEETNAKLVEKNNALLIKVANLEEEVSQLKNQGHKTESDIVKQLKADKKELSTKLKALEDSVVDEATLRESIRKELEGEYEVKLYKSNKIGELKDEIIPELVTGNTKEEIDASLEIAKTKFKEIQERILGSVKIPSATPTVSQAKVHSGTLKIEDVANLDPSSPEYREFRAKLGLR